MEFFKKVLGGPGGKNDKGATKVGAQQKTEAALQDLKSKQRDCETKLTDIQRRIDDTTNEVKALVQKGQREKAKMVLRRKNMLVKQVTSVQNERCPTQNSDRLAEQILQMEMSQSNIQTVAALQQAAAAGKANLKANDIEDVDLVLDEIAEQNDEMGMISDALAQTTIGGVDEDDLEAELNEFEDMQVDETFATVPQTKLPTAADMDLPAAPTTAAAASKTAEDLELEKLLAETGMTPAQ